MSKRHALGSMLVSLLLSGTSYGQTEKVDFRTDVLPVIRQNCIVCHGPTQQMNGFRLDRRSVAMRGGTRTVIVPGSAESSRLYLRLVGNQYGNQMPPAGALSTEAIHAVKAWIDQGAEWPDDLANEVEMPPSDPRAVRMVAAIRSRDKAALDGLVAENPKVLNMRGPDGSTPFMYAVLYSDLPTVRRMLEAGADPNKANDARATALMWAAMNLDKTRLLLDKGAEINARSDDGRTPLFIASTRAGNAPIVKLLLEHGANPNPSRRSTADSTPLREAAAAADYEMMELLIDKGADIQAAGSAMISSVLDADCTKCLALIEKKLDAKAYSSALLTLGVASDPVKVKFALDHGADVNTKDVEGRTPLIFAANSDLMQLDTVKLLLERGADVNARTLSGETALAMARRHGDSPIVALLKKAGAKADSEAAPNLKVRKTNSIQTAVAGSVPLLQRADLAFMKKSGCTSCHNQGLPAMTVGVVRKSGFKVDEDLVAKQTQNVTSFFDGWRDRLIQGIAPGGVAYTLVSLHGLDYKPDVITDSIARYIRMRQLPDGHWRPGCGGSRLPSCGAEIANTALSLRALQAYGLGIEKADFDRAVERAAAWLAKSTARTTDDRAFRLMGLAWAGRDKAAIQQAIQELASTQRADGGWSDVPTMKSGPFATGEALMALHEAGVSVSDATYQRGVEFLLKTQLEDGSWYQRTRSLAVQPYFDASFPHGYDQWISAASTGWATMALAVAARDPRPSSAPVAGAGKSR